jgi:hypothetical protein
MPARQIAAVIGSAIAIVAGALAWVVPPHALGLIVHHNPDVPSNWLGDGIWSIQPTISISLCAAIAFVYGVLFPKIWYLSFPAMILVVPLNFMIDWWHDLTSHNLWPFEVVIFAWWTLPALAAAWIGKLANQQLVAAGQGRRG